MPQGLQTFYADGRIQLDLTDRLTRFITSGTYTPPAGTGLRTAFVSVPGMANDGTWIAIASSGPGAGNPVTIVSGGFNVACYDSFGGPSLTNYYSVYRV